MRSLPIALFAAMLSTAPAFADEQPTMEQRLQEALRGFMDDMKPALDDALDETLKFFDAFGTIDDPRHYDLPEVLPNGDIIIRRRDDAPAFEPPKAAPNEDGTIDL